MKYIKTFAIVALIFAIHSMAAQSAESNLDKWPAMKEFHSVMARCFHPTEEGNFEPLRNFAETLANKATELSKKEIPAEFKTKQVMAAITRLQAKTQEVDKMVKAKASNEELKKPISEAHDIFHEIIGLCSAQKTEKK